VGLAQVYRSGNEGSISELSATRSRHRNFRRENGHCRLLNFDDLGQLGTAVLIDNSPLKNYSIGS
jgi:hypothetical protein